MKPVINSIQTQEVKVGQVWRAIPGNGAMEGDSHIIVVEIDTEKMGPRQTGQYRVGYEYISGYIWAYGIYHRYLDDFLKRVELVRERR